MRSSGATPLPHAGDRRILGSLFGVPVTLAVLAVLVLADGPSRNAALLSLVLAVMALAAAIPPFMVAGDRLGALRDTRRQARADALTGLGNRQHLQQVLPELLAGAGPATPVALFLIDLDGFKDVNRSFGHEVGDRLLVRMAERLRALVDPADVLVRLGGDQFVVVQANAWDLTAPTALAERITLAIAEPASINGASIVVRAHVGLAVCPEDATTPEVLFRKADTALDSAKRGGMGYARFEESQDDRARLRNDLAAQLVTGLDPAQFQVYYQPVMDLAEGQVRGAEALIRWHHPTRGVLAPGTFLDLVDELGANGAVTNLVLDQALAAAAEWLTRISLDFTMAINITSADIQDHDFSRRVAMLVARHRVNPGCVILEVTESTLLSDIGAATATLQGLRNLGIRIALDDFGTGYSSLSHLRDLPIDQLKLDRSFITGLEHDSVSEAIVRSVVGLAGVLNLSLVAEGIEQDSTAAAVALIGCSHAQGFLWSPALTMRDFDIWRRQRSRRLSPTSSVSSVSSRGPS